MRFCCHCRAEIPLDVLIRGKWKALFCSKNCREADRTLLRASRREYRVQKGNCPACGHRATVREQTQAEANWQSP
jgi:ribosomal protein L37E